ncbi:hypothetical protein [Paenibacillus sp. GCM10027626]|uniref:hypothetical protein n=1 Tax=Paenibacillus sp. GCM10027626 TaxID=3273411 RepID=UPI0036413A2A
MYQKVQVKLLSLLATPIHEALRKLVSGISLASLKECLSGSAWALSFSFEFDSLAR